MITQTRPRLDRIPRNPQEAMALATASCMAWNHTYPVGTKVHVYRLLGDESTAIDTTTTSQAWVMGGHSAMVMIHGLSGGHCLTHVKPCVASAIHPAGEKAGAFALQQDVGRDDRRATGKRGGGMSATPKPGSILERLQWDTQDPAKVIGYLCGERHTALFLIVDMLESFSLFGAFVPDEDERKITYETLEQAQSAARIYLSRWMLQRQEEFRCMQQQELDQIGSALAVYHAMLDRRENGNGAAHILVDKIEVLFGKPWVQGASLAGKEAA